VAAVAKSEPDRIDYLVFRRFPAARWMNIPPVLSSRGRPQPVDPQLRPQVDAYRAELAALAPNDLAARFDAERGKEAEETRQQLEREEGERFFHHPRAKADFEHWAKAAHWTLDEAIALSFGKAPEVVRWDAVTNFVKQSPFAFAYQRRRDLALRAVQWKQLYDPVLPGIFLAWAKRSDLPVPPELEAAVTARGVTIADWQSLYERLSETYERLSQANAELQGKFEHHHQQ
jgi:hypothetical protein